MIEEYESLLEDETFKSGERKGSMTTALTILTDMLLELNSLEVYYQKPASKSINPPELTHLRIKVEAVKTLLHRALKEPAL